MILIFFYFKEYICILVPYWQGLDLRQIIFCVNLAESQDAQICDWSLFLEAFVRLFWGEIIIWINRFVMPKQSPKGLFSSKLTVVRETPHSEAADGRSVARTQSSGRF